MGWDECVRLSDEVGLVGGESVQEVGVAGRVQQGSWRAPSGEVRVGRGVSDKRELFGVVGADEERSKLSEGSESHGSGRGIIGGVHKKNPPYYFVTGEAFASTGGGEEVREIRPTLTARRGPRGP